MSECSAKELHRRHLAETRRGNQCDVAHRRVTLADRERENAALISCYVWNRSHFRLDSSCRRRCFVVGLVSYETKALRKWQWECIPEADLHTTRYILLLRLSTTMCLCSYRLMATEARVVVMKVWCYAKGCVRGHVPKYVIHIDALL